MPNRPSRRAWLLALAGTLPLAGCIVVPAGHPRARRGAEYDDDDYEVAEGPPPPQAEVQIVAPGPGFFWIAGYWAWMGGRHTWIRGRWEPVRPGWRWVPYSWTRRGRGWRPVPGRWQRD